MERGEKPRAAIAGFGAVAEGAHAQALIEKSVDVVAIAEYNSERRQAAARVFPKAVLYSDLEALLDAEPNLDFVDIATPPFLHEPQALSVLKRGISVLCEKPLALTVSDFGALAFIAERDGLVLWTVHNWAYAPQWLKVWELLASSDFGRPLAMDIRALRMAPAKNAGPEDWRMDAEKAGGGILVDHGWHNLYLMYRIFGIYPHPNPLPEGEGIKGALSRGEGIKNSLARKAGEGRGEGISAEDEISVSLAFGAAKAHLELSWKAAERKNSARMEFERGIIDLDDDVLNVFGVRQKTISFPEKLSQSSAHPAWFSAMLDDFLPSLAKPELSRKNLKEAEFCCRTIAGIYAARNPHPSPSERGQGEGDVR